METVEISVQDDTLAHDPVDGVVVRVYDVAGATLITEATTGDVLPGKVQVTLPGDDPAIRYQLRFYVNGGALRSPQYVDVYTPISSSPTGANNFTVEAAMFTLVAATNPRLCRASGYVWGPDGRAKRGIDLALIPTFNPLVVDGYGVLGERVDVRSDADGYLCVDLLRSGIYNVTIEGHENYLRQVHVPDRSSINIFHLLFPVLASVSYAPAGPWSLAAGEQLLLSPTVISNDYRTLVGAGKDDVVYAVDDTTVASVMILDTMTVSISGVSPGSTILRATRKDTTVVYIPDPGIIGGEIAITVA